MSGKAINIIGKRVGRLVVEGRADPPVSCKHRRHSYWTCKCDCGSVSIQRGDHLRSSPPKVLSCGCLLREFYENTIVDHTGIRCGYLTVIGRSKPEEYGNQKGHIYWECRCDCGTIIHVASSDIQKGTRDKGGTRSCGCIRPGKRVDDNVLKISRIIKNYYRSAKARHIEWALTEEQVSLLVSKQCAYCGCMPSNSLPIREGVRTPYNGIDRINSDKGYTIDNCVACCRNCNMAKRDRKLKDYVLWIKKSYEYLVSKGML